MTQPTVRTWPAVDAADTALPEWLVVRLLVVLSAAAGALDAVCVMRLGGAFASVVTAVAPSSARASRSASAAPTTAATPRPCGISSRPVGAVFR